MDGVSPPPEAWEPEGPAQYLCSSQDCALLEKDFRSHAWDLLEPIVYFGVTSPSAPITVTTTLASTLLYLLSQPLVLINLLCVPSYSCCYNQLHPLLHPFSSACPPLLSSWLALTTWSFWICKSYRVLAWSMSTTLGGVFHFDLGTSRPHLAFQYTTFCQILFQYCFISTLGGTVLLWFPCHRECILDGSVENIWVILLASVCLVQLFKQSETDKERFTALAKVSDTAAGCIFYPFLHHTTWWGWLWLFSKHYPQWRRRIKERELQKVVMCDFLICNSGKSADLSDIPHFVLKIQTFMMCCLS